MIPSLTSFKTFYSQARITHLKRCFDDLIEEAGMSQGIHPSLAVKFEEIFQLVEHVGGDIGREKRRRTSARTWADSTAVTLYMN